jgi:energy-converting hydrogenase Eha subunit A
LKLNSLLLQVLESCINPKIDLDSWLWKLPETFGPCSPPDQTSPMESLKLQSLAKVSSLIRDPHLNLPEIQSTYGKMRADCAKMRNVLSKFINPISSSGTPITPLTLSARKLHARYLAAYSVLLCIAITLNAILSRYQPFNHSLIEQSVTFVDEVIALAEEASQYRPLGSSSIPLCLVAALVATDDTAKRDRMEKQLAEYQTDFNSANWQEMASRLRVKIGNPRFDIPMAYTEEYAEVC